MISFPIIKKSEKVSKGPRKVKFKAEKLGAKKQDTWKRIMSGFHVRHWLELNLNWIELILELMKPNSVIRIVFGGGV